MQKVFRFLLTFVLMLSLSVCAYADTDLQPVSSNSPEYGTPLKNNISSGVTPYALVNPLSNSSFLTSRSGSSGTWTSLVSEGDLYTGSGAILSYVGSTSSNYQNTFYLKYYNPMPLHEGEYWWNFVGKITDANGYVLKPSDFNYFCMFAVSYANGSFGTNQGSVTPASDNCYGFSDGYLQIAVSLTDWDYSNMCSALGVNVSNPDVVGPLSFEIEKFDLYTNESSTPYPFDFGSNAHNAPPAGPKDPNDASQYGSASDQVQWYNDAFGGAVDPELDNKIVAGNDMLLQQEEIEQDVIADFQQYSSQVDPANITFPTAVLNGMSFIGTTFMSSYNNLGDISFVISLSMMIGVVLVLIGRGEGALARGISASSRERRRTEYASERDMKKGG